MNTSIAAEQEPKNPKSLTELLEGVPKMLSTTSVQIMVIGMMPLAIKSQKAENPELYYATKARLRDFHAEVLRHMGDMKKYLDELE